MSEASSTRRIALVPGVLALSPQYASLIDPVAPLRAAVEAAVGWVEEVGDGAVFVANGSAKRSEKAPGYFDERALAFDDELRELLTIDPDGLASLDTELAEELWADVAALPDLAAALAAGSARLISVDYDDDPYGVKYWVMRWEVS